MTTVPRHTFERYLKEALEALIQAEKIVNEYDINSFLQDLKARYALRYSIILIVESLADLALAILEKDFNLEPRSYREAFMLLAEKGVVSASLASKMEKLSALRNMIVHRYWKIDDKQVYLNAKQGGLDAVKLFIDEVRKYGQVTDP